MIAEETIILGVVSGILASSVLLICSSILKKIVLPWFRDQVYDDQYVDGVWICDTLHQSGNSMEAILDISQKAHLIKGHMTLNKKNGNSEIEIKKYILKGEIRDRFLIVHGRNQDRNSLGVHSELLEVIGDGKKMKGTKTWYSVSEQKIESMEVEWVKKI